MIAGRTGLVDNFPATSWTPTLRKGHEENWVAAEELKSS